MSFYYNVVISLFIVELEFLRMSISRVWFFLRLDILICSKKWTFFIQFSLILSHSFIYINNSTCSINATNGMLNWRRFDFSGYHECVYFIAIVIFSVFIYFSFITLKIISEIIETYSICTRSWKNSLIFKILIIVLSTKNKNTRANIIYLSEKNAILKMQLFLLSK